MKAKPLFVVIGLLLIVIVSLTSLVLLTELPNENSNGFTRRIRTNFISLTKDTDNILPVSRICGLTSNNIYLVGSEPNTIYSINYELNKIDTIHYDYPDSSLITRPNNVQIDSPNIYVHLNNSATFISLNLNSLALRPKSLKIPVFTKSTQVSDSIVALRGFKNKSTTQVFKLVNMNSGEILIERPLISDDMNGGFSTDGRLKYNKHEKKIIYVPYFQNDIFCLDSNLNSVYHSNTIDTNRNNNISIQKISKGSTEKLMPSHSRKLVNNDFFIGGGKIFIQSALKADNEKLSFFNENSVIDLYDINNGKYLESFYIPNISSSEIKGIDLFENRLIVLTKRKIYIFRILS